MCFSPCNAIDECILGNSKQAKIEMIVHLFYSSILLTRNFDVIDLFCVLEQIS